MKPTKIEFTAKSVLYLFFLVLALLATISLLSELKQLLVIFGVAFIISEALHPTVTKLETKGFPRFAALLAIYLLVIGLFSLAISGIIPVFTEQSARLAKEGPSLLQNIKIAGFPIDVSSVFRIFESLPATLGKGTVTLLSNLLQAILIMVITFYMVMQRPNLSQKTLSFLGKQGSTLAFSILQKLEQRLASWILGQFTLMVLVGILSFVGFSLIGMEYAVSLALIAGILEAVPNLGPVISMFLAGLVGLTTGNIVTAGLAMSVGIVVQQLENHLIVPKVMKDVVGLNPLITIMLLLSGSQIAGVLGAILAIPVFLASQTVLTEIAIYQKKSKATNKPNSV